MRALRCVPSNHATISLGLRIERLMIGVFTPAAIDCQRDSQNFARASTPAVRVDLAVVVRERRLQRDDQLVEVELLPVGLLARASPRHARVTTARCTICICTSPAACAISWWYPYSAGLRESSSRDSECACPVLRYTCAATSPARVARRLVPQLGGVGGAAEQVGARERDVLGRTRAR